MCKLGYDYSPCRRYNNRKMFWNLEENAPEVTRFISDFTKCRISLLASSPRKVHLDVAAASSHSMCILSSQAHPFPCLFTYPFAATGEAATTGPATTTGAATTKEAAATVAGCRAAGAVHSHSTQSHSTYSHLWHTHSPSNSITHLLPQEKPPPQNEPLLLQNAEQQVLYMATLLPEEKPPPQTQPPPREQPQPRKQLRLLQDAEQQVLYIATACIHSMLA